MKDFIYEILIGLCNSKGNFDKKFVVDKIRLSGSLSSKEKVFILNGIKSCVSREDLVTYISDLLIYESDVLDSGVAMFDKVSYNVFKDSMNGFGYTEETVKTIYNGINLPKRATKGSAGYDFFSPIHFSLCSGESIILPTGIRCGMDDDYVLQIYPRSGLGFKYRCQIDNTVGIIDSDYYNSDNEGCIMLKITNDSKTDKTMVIQAGQGIAQGIFLQYGKVIGDDTKGVRNGGFGSTTK